MYILWPTVTASAAVSEISQPPVEVAETAEEVMQETERASYKRMLRELQEKILSYEQKLRLPSQTANDPLAHEAREEVIAASILYYYIPDIYSRAIHR